MKKIALACLIVLAGTAHAQTIPMKPGLWKTHTTRMVVDGKDIAAQMATMQQRMAAMMAQLTPEQRKQMAEHMSSQMGMHGMEADGSMRMCITTAMLSNPAAFTPKGAGESCTQGSKVAVHGNRVTMDFKCERQGVSQSGHVEALVNGDHVTSHMHMETSGAQGSHVVDGESQMTYLGADCQGVQPLGSMMGSHS